MTENRFTRLSAVCYGAALVALPGAGVGTVHLLTGVATEAGFQPSYLLMAMACLLAAVGVRPAELRRNWHQGQPFSGLLALSMAVILVSGLGIVLHPAVPPAVSWPRFGRQVLQYGIMLPFVVYPWVWTRGRRRWNLTCSALAVGLIFETLYATLQVMAYLHPSAWFTRLDGWFTSNPSILAGSKELYLGTGFRQIPRLRGTMCEPLYFGNYLLLVIPWLLLPWWRRSWSWLLPAGGAGLLLLTWARGAYVAAAVAVAVGLSLLRRAHLGVARPAWGRRLLGGVLLSALLISIIWGPAVLLLPWERLQQSFSSQDWSNLTRLYSMQAGWRAFKLSPVVVIGWGQFAFHFPGLVDSHGLQSQFDWPVVNNFPLEILCETGLAGLVTFLAAGSLLGLALWRSLPSCPDGPRNERRERQLRLVAGGTAAAGIWCQLLTFSQYNLPHIWVALGLLLAAWQENRAPVVTAPPTGIFPA
jgi:hypothetical protein